MRGGGLKRSERVLRCFVFCITYFTVNTTFLFLSSPFHDRFLERLGWGNVQV